MQRELGRGNFGMVCLATYVSRAGNDRDVALKFMRRRAGAVEYDELQDELRMLREAAHPHVIEVLGVLTEAEVRTSTSDKIRGMGLALIFPAADIDVASFIRRRGRLDASLSQALADQLASALAHVHAAGIVHRDVKPSNLLLFFSGEGALPGGFVPCSLKLADFGSSRKLPRPPPPGGEAEQDKREADPRGVPRRRRHAARHVCGGFHGCLSGPRAHRGHDDACVRRRQTRALARSLWGGH